MLNQYSAGRTVSSLVLAGCVLAVGAAFSDASAACATMRKINIGVSVSPPNVVHTSPYIAKELGFFEKHCIDASIIQFDGGGSPAAKAAAAQGTALVSVQPIAIGRGVKVQQIWGLAPRMPQAYMVAEDIKTAKDLKGRKLSASGGGVRVVDIFRRGGEGGGGATSAGTPLEAFSAATTRSQSSAVPRPASARAFTLTSTGATSRSAPVACGSSDSCACASRYQRPLWRPSLYGSSMKRTGVPTGT